MSNCHFVVDIVDIDIIIGLAFFKFDIDVDIDNKVGLGHV